MQYNFLHDIGEKLHFNYNDRPDYEVVNRFHGSFGEVYGLKSLGSRPTVYFSAKTPKAEIKLDSELFELFKQEAILWMKIPLHPNIMPCLGVASYNHRPYVFTKYIEDPYNIGSSLDRYIKITKSTTRQVIQILGIIVDVMKHLERFDCRFIHGDIKPSNILTEQRENGLALYLTDFGLSYILKSSTSNNHFYTKGDIYHIPPEALVEETPRIPAFDMHCIGVTIYELLFSAPFFTVNIRSGERKRLMSIKNIRTMGKEVKAPKSLIDLILRLTNTNPNKRPSSFCSLQDEFERSFFPKDYQVEIKGISNADKIIMTDLEALFTKEYKAFLFEKKYTKVRIEHLENELIEIMSYIQLKKGPIMLNRTILLMEEFKELACILLPLGVIYYQQNEVQNAYLVWSTAIEIYSKDTTQFSVDQNCFADIASNLGMFLSSVPILSSREKAIELSLKATKIKPTSTRALATLGKALIAVGKLEEAESILEKSFYIDSNYIMIKCWLAVLRKLKNPNHSLQDEVEKLNLDRRYYEALNEFLHDDKFLITK